MALIMSEPEVTIMHNDFDDTFPAPYGTGQGEFDALEKRQPDPRSKWASRIVHAGIAITLIACLWAIFIH